MDVLSTWAGACHLSALSLLWWHTFISTVPLLAPSSYIRMINPWIELILVDKDFKELSTLPPENEGCLRFIFWQEQRCPCPSLFHPLMLPLLQKLSVLKVPDDWGRTTYTIYTWKSLPIPFVLKPFLYHPSQDLFRTTDPAPQFKDLPGMIWHSGGA